MARPTELTDEISQEITKHLIRGCSIADAAALAGISEQTYHNWIKRGEAGEEPFFGFLGLTRAARADARSRIVRTVRRAAREGDWKAAAWFLERSDRANWGRTVDAKVEHSGPNGGPIEIDVTKMSDDELRAIVEGKSGGGT